MFSSKTSSRPTAISGVFKILMLCIASISFMALVANAPLPAHAETPSPTPTPAQTLPEGAPKEVGKLPSPLEMQSWVRDFCGSDDDIVILKEKKGVVYSQNGQYVKGEIPMREGDYVLVTANEGEAGVKQMVLHRKELGLSDTPCGAPGAEPEKPSMMPNIWTALVAAIVGLLLGAGGYLFYSKRKGSKSEPIEAEIVEQFSADSEVDAAEESSPKE